MGLLPRNSTQTLAVFIELEGAMTFEPLALELALDNELEKALAGAKPISVVVPILSELVVLKL